jgi:hypothetical protein
VLSRFGVYAGRAKVARLHARQVVHEYPHAT